MDKKLRRNLMLKMLDAVEDASGNQTVFSVAFIKKDGERVFFPRAVKTGLKMDVKANRMRGILPVDEKGNPNGHVYPVSIDNFIEFNGMEVYL